MFCLWQLLYQVLFKYHEGFLSYGPMFKFLHDADDDDVNNCANADDKALTIARLFLPKTDELKTTKEIHESNHEDDQLQLSNVNLRRTFA